MSNRIHSSAEDHQISGTQPPKSAPGGWKSVKYILGMETFEKLASISLVANLVLYLRNMYNLDIATSANISIIWNGSGNILALVGALVADTYLGKFKTILFASLSSLLGIGLMTLTAGIPIFRPSHCEEQSQNCQHPLRWQMAVLYGALGLLAIGAGGIRPCNVSFGADQFDKTTEKGVQQLSSFINWYFFLFTAVVLIVLTGVVYVQTNISWFIGFAIPTGCIVLSISLFLIGRHTYVLLKPQGSIFVDLAKVIVAAFRKRDIISIGQIPFYDPHLIAGKNLSQTRRFRFFDKAAMIVEPGELDEMGLPKNGWRLCSVQMVEQFKCVVAITPILVTGIFTHMAQQQPPTFGILQAVQMDKNARKFKIPPAWVKLTVLLTVSLWILFYEKIYIPLMQKWSKKDRRLSIQLRFTIGLVCSILCMIVSGIIEKKRKESALRNGTFESPMSIAYLILPFAMAGLTEAFAGIALMEYIMTQWPEHMRTLAGGIFLFSMSITNYLNSIIVGVINKLSKINGQSPWLNGNDLNKSKLDYYYYTIGFLAALNLVYFLVSARHYLTTVVADDSEKQVDMEEFA
ncbi:hypothetical protein UlMin_000426 [Ulmus minor]